MMELLGEVLSRAQIINGSASIGGDDGVHWKAVRAAARLVKHVEEESPHGQGTFSFAATAVRASSFGLTCFVGRQARPGLARHSWHIRRGSWLRSF